MMQSFRKEFWSVIRDISYTLYDYKELLYLVILIVFSIGFTAGGITSNIIFSSIVQEHGHKIFK